ncbi:MAG: type II/IV secretion system protein [Nitrospira sp.]|uniref:Type II secretory pathway, ATPase PulE/Tfp pilus assembly pathway, ATPase PilB n=1 Tax=Nitrospira defluvii TaxID=330214 RepID=A0ABM8QVG9_9BACT|nr:GspE/PulE family protein [Nitrospira defluvii]MCS6325783.1 type II/IV secretion system protein [Nitrospira sp.]CAE6717362.1 Type II secretory pathway, ATPase PulE/Tfp pilus assembly pathway, ATPase PilB [Nitrospira defluvii]
MIRATVSALPSAGVGQSVSRAQETHGRGRYDQLVLQGFLRQEELAIALSEAARKRLDAATCLMDRYRIPKPAIGAALAEFYRCPFLDYDEQIVVERDLLKNLSFDYLRMNHWVPLRRHSSGVDVLIDNPHDADKLLDIRRAFPGQAISYRVGLRADIERVLSEVSGREVGDPINDILGELVSEAQLEEQQNATIAAITENDSAIVRLANQIIAEAYRRGASDIHIEPYSDRKETAVRFRVDGSCFIYMKIPAAYRRAIVSRVKIMASLDIAERRKPQDGKIRFKLSTGQEIELRVATLPTAGFNEDVVIRLLSANGPRRLDDLEFSDETRRLVSALAEKPHGIVLCAGPTGSGKTTTLHAILASINTDERKIWTAEDPIEITQDGLRQVQVHPKIGLTFATTMRAFLRADPDVIMIGEMRDKETADIAIEASLTGHLVFSTIHTNSAVETVVRLLDLGCDPFNFSDAMLGVLAMRLCKRICLNCREAYQSTRNEFEELVQAFGLGEWERVHAGGSTSLTLYRGRGCEACNHSGYHGRVPIHELMVVSDRMKALIQARTRTGELLALAKSEGMKTLLQDGIEKVLQGMTTYKQVRAVAIK